MFRPSDLIEACLNPSKEENIQLVGKFVDIYLKAKEDGLNPDLGFFETLHKVKGLGKNNGSYEYLNSLHIAAGFGSIPLLEQLLRIEEINLDAMSIREVANPLIEPNTPQLAETPLCIAARMGHAEALRLLLIHGARVEVPAYYPNTNDNHCKTPLIVAIQHGHFDLAAPLLSKGGPYEPSIVCSYIPIFELMRFTDDDKREQVLPVLSFMLKDLHNIEVNHVICSKSLLEWAYSFHLDYVQLLLETRRVYTASIRKVLQHAAADENLKAFTLLLRFLKIEDIAKTSIPTSWRKKTGIKQLNAIKMAAQNFMKIKKLLGQSKIDANKLFNTLLSALTLWPGILQHDIEAEKLMKKCLPMFIDFDQRDNWQKKFKMLSQVECEQLEIKDKINLLLGKFLCRRKGEISFDEVDFGIHLLFNIPSPLDDEEPSSHKECKQLAKKYRGLALSMIENMKKNQLKSILIEIETKEGDLIGSSGSSENDLIERYHAHLDEEVERIWGDEEIVIIDASLEDSTSSLVFSPNAKLQEKAKPAVEEIERARTMSSSSVNSKSEEENSSTPFRSRSFDEISSSPTRSLVESDKSRPTSFFGSSFLRFARSSNSYPTRRAKAKETVKDSNEEKSVKLRSVRGSPSSED